MGQKINPNGFRLSLEKDWESTWYMPKEKYGDTVFDDYRIRNFVKKELKAAGVERVEIKRSISKIEVEIRVARPGVVIGRGGEQIENLKKSLSRMIKEKVELKVV